MKRRITLILTLILGCLIFAIAQVPSSVNIDSLLSIWKDTNQPDTVRLEALHKISWDGYRRTAPDSSFYYAQLQYDFAEESRNKKWMGLALNTQGGYYLVKSDLDLAFEYYSRSGTIFEEIGDKENLATASSNIGSIYVRQGEYEKGLESKFLTLKTFEEIKNNEKIGYTLQTIGLIYFRQSDLDQALFYANKSYNIFKEINDKHGQAEAQNVIGNVYLQKEDYQQALEIYKQNLEIYQELGIMQGIIGTQSNIANVYRGLGDINNALEKYEIVLEGFESLGVPHGVAGILLQIGNIYQEQKEYPLALDYFNRSLSVSEEIGYKEGVMLALTSIAANHGNQGDHVNALSVGNRAFTLAEEMEDLQSTNNLSQGLVLSYKATGQYKKALEMAEVFLDTKDSLNSQENQKAILQTQIQSEFDKQKAIDDLESERLVAIETQKKKNQQILSAVIGLGLFLVLILAIGLWSRNKYIKKTNASLAIAKDRAERSEKYKEQFLANMSHEIRTPMHAISGMVKILERNDHPPTQDVFLNAMRTSSDNLVVILNDVLDLSKIEAGKLEIESIPMNPSLVLENAVNILKYKAEEKGLGIHFNIDSEVPEFILGDPARLNQILLNLISNAIKFTEKGRVDIFLSNQGGLLRFRIKDTGISISADKVERIFGAFEQAKDSTSRSYGGTGLGLSISKQLVELQYGKIWAESQEGQGSTFYVELPIVEAAIGTSQNLISGDQLKAMAESLKGTYILMAEDNAFNQMIAKDDLNYYIKDVRIDVVPNGAVALEKFQLNKYDLILMDVQMPEMNGFEATKRIREIERSEGRQKNISIIAMTASMLKSEVESCYESGMDNYIPKPYSADELIGRIYEELHVV